MELSDTKQALSFESFFSPTEKGHPYALVSVFGAEDGRDASSQALLYGWENWDRLQEMANPAGYLYRVGQTWGRRNGHQPKALPAVSEHHEPWVEPRLPEALAALSDHQRVAVVLRHGVDWSYDQIAEFLESSTVSVRKNVERGLTNLRVTLEVSHEY
jgi:DNA-directed RNA polymerase specialized sigma24 family protein